MDPTTLLAPVSAAIAHHPLAVLLAIVGWWGFSGAVSYIKPPVPTSPAWYGPLYGALHAIAGNLSKVSQILSRGKSL